MGIYDQQQQLVDSVCEDIASFRTLIAPKDESKKSEFGFVPGMNNMQNAVNALDGHLRNLREGVFPVLFIGGFSSGKSTLLNALMRKELLSSSINAETAVVTKIVFNSKEEKAVVYAKEIDEKGQPYTTEHTIADFFEIYQVDRNEPAKFEWVDYALIRQTQNGIGGSLVQLVDSPGTSNSKADTLAARKFADNANAIVYVINAVQPFTDEDKQYIKEHYAGRGFRNLFFVINRYDDVQPAEQEALKENVRNQLHDVFSVDGKFDRALFDSRVFYTNALGALNTGLGRETKTAYGSFLLDDSKTGVPEFEKALVAFLTADDRDKNAFAAYVPKLSAMYTLAKAKTAEELERYKAGQAELDREWDALNAAADKVERILSDIQYSCQINAAEFVRDIQRDYDEFIAFIDREWDDHFSDPDVLGNIEFHDIRLIQIAAAKDQKKKDELAAPLMEAVEAFIASRQDVLNHNIEQAIQFNAVKLANSLQNYQHQLEALDCPIDPNEILIAFSVGDFDIAAGSVVGMAINTRDIVLELAMIALAMFSWPFTFPKLYFKPDLRRMTKKLLLGMKDQVISELDKAKDELLFNVYRTVGGAILRAGEECSGAYRTELAGYQESLAQMIADLDNENFNLSDEEERAKRRLEKMVDIISHVSLLTTGKCLSESDVLARAAV